MFETIEYCERIKRLQKKLQASHLDALVVCADHNVTYLTGIHCESGDRRILLVVPAKGDPCLIVPCMEKETYPSSGSIGIIKIYWEKDAKPGRGWEDELHKALSSSQYIGIDPHAYMEVVAELAQYKYSLCELVEDLRVIKSPAEIALTRRVAGFWTQAMNNMLSIAKPGLPVSELMRVGGNVAKDIYACEVNSNFSNTQVVQFFQCAPLSSTPHYSSRPNDCLPNGPTIINALGPVCGYHAENERTILTGDYTAEHVDLFDMINRAHGLALRLIKPGVRCADVDCAVQEFFTEQGVAEHMRHRVGHGFGLVYHERPFVSEGAHEIFQPGMIISVEPGLYVSGTGGFRHSDTILVTDDGIENFSMGTPKDIKSLSF